MKRSTALVIAGLFATVGAGCAGQSASTTACNTPNCCCAVPAGASTSVDAKTADALRAALQDERRAHAFYSAVLAKYGQVRPFSNIVHAEQRHEGVVTALMRRHGVAVPPADAGAAPAVPGTLKECNALAAQFERENIAMYDRLLSDVTEPDIRTAFENLQSVSRNNHLPAFDRWATNDKAGSPAFGRGTGRGAGSAG